MRHEQALPFFASTPPLPPRALLLFLFFLPGPRAKQDQYTWPQGKKPTGKGGVLLRVGGGCWWNRDIVGGGIMMEERRGERFALLELHMPGCNDAGTRRSEEGVVRFFFFFFLGDGRVPLQY